MGDTEYGPLEDDGERDDQHGAEEEAVGEEGEDEEPCIDDHLGEQHLPRGEQLDQHHADGRTPLRLERRRPPHLVLLSRISRLRLSTRLIDQQSERRRIAAESAA